MQGLNAHQKAEIVKRTLQGQTINEIGPAIGVNPCTVWRNQHKPEIRSIIEREANKIINSGLKPARRTLTRLAAIGNTKCNDKDMLKLSLDASKHITAIAGLSGNGSNTIINQLIQINQAPEQSKELTALANFMSANWSQGAIDCKTISTNPVDNKSGHGTTSLASPHTSAAAIDIPTSDNVLSDDPGIPTVDNPVDKSITPQVAGNVYRGKRNKST